MRYAVVIEKAGDDYSAYVQDLPGCVATAVSSRNWSRSCARRSASISEGLKEDGLPVPPPSAAAEYVEA